MKYVAIIDNDGELSEESIEEIKNTIFVGNHSRYCFEVISIKQVPEKMSEYVVDDFPKLLDAISRMKEE